MPTLRVGVVTHSDLFAAGIRQLLSQGGPFEVLRVEANLRSIRRHSPIHVLVLDSESVRRLKLGALLLFPGLPNFRVLVMDLGHNRAVVFDRSRSMFTQEEDLVSLMLPANFR